MSRKQAQPSALTSTQCYCQSGHSFESCCQPVLTKDQYVETAEMLMRSRYTAFCLHNQTYLLETWHPSTRPKSIEFHTQQLWLGLKVVTTQGGGLEDAEGQVEFIARYKIQGKAYRLHECSEFLRQDQRWYYTQGRLFDH